MKQRNRILIGIAAMTAFVAAGPLAGLAIPTAGAAPVTTQTIQISIDLIAGTQTFVAAGPINGTGAYGDVSSRDTGRVSHGVSAFSMEAGLQTGSTFTVKHVGTQTDDMNFTTCTDTIVGSGNYVITGGTGALSHAMGSGHFTVAGTISFAMVDSVCDPNVDAVVSGTETITAVGQGKV